jgi:hypothetical protein
MYFNSRRPITLIDIKGAAGFKAFLFLARDFCRDVMKPGLLAAIIFLFLTSCTNNLKSGSYTETSTDIEGNPVIIKVDTNVMANDTFFLKRKTMNGVKHQQVFIDTHKSSRYYDMVFGLNQFDNENIKYYLNELAKSKKKLDHVNLGDLPTEWRPVVKFHGKYYLYYPSDTGTKGTVMVSDSTLMPYYFGDDYLPIALTSVTKSGDIVYNLKTTHYVPTDRSCPTEVNIYVLDKVTKLSVWEIKGEHPIQYRLMIPRETMRSLPVIVNSSANKEPEFDFEKIDYQKLIRDK